MMSDLKSALRELLREDEESHDAAFQLWTWLPSYHFATKAHGDYAADAAGFPPATIMQEALMVFAYLKNKDYSDLEKVEVRQSFGCGCDECPIPEQHEIEEVLKAMMTR